MNKLGRLIVAPAVVVVAVLLMGAKCESTDGTPKGPLVEAKKACGNSPYVMIQDGGKTLTMNEMGERDADGAPRPLMSCVFDELDVPSRVLEHLNRTSSRDGQQSDRWGKYAAQWSFHPDRGVSITITRR